MTLQTFIFGGIFIIAGALFVSLFLKSFYDKKFVKALLIKGLGSLCFFGFALFNFFSGEFSFARLTILIGLGLGVIGDEVIALCQVYPNHDKEHFLGGGVFFVVGHIFYMGTMIFLLGGPNWIALVIAFVLLLALSFFYESKKKFFANELGGSLKLYISIVIFFASVGIGLFLKHGTAWAALLALGGILFTVSDNILFAFKLGKGAKFKQNIELHVAYYLAQFAIAWSISCI